MVTVQFSQREELVLPESLGRALGLREGDLVDVQPRGDLLWFRRQDTEPVPGPLTDLAQIVFSSLPIGSVDVETYMGKHGYEQIDGRADLRL